MQSQRDALTLASHDFSFSLYKELAKTETGNMFFSPFSINLLMLMASSGAASNTYDEIISTLNLNKSINFLEVYQYALERLLRKYNLNLANGMFVDCSFEVKESFVEKSSNYLKSSVIKLNLNYDQELQRKFINEWILDNTNYKIREIIPEGTHENLAPLVLAGALQLRSAWEYKFNNSKKEPFYLTRNKKVTVKMMSLHENLYYYHDAHLKFAALRLPYEYFQGCSMIVLLPDSKDGFKNLENNISKIKLFEIIKKMKIHKVNVKFPHFKMEQSVQLKQALTNLGCPTMFTKAANFSNMVEEDDLFVGSFWQKALIDIDETGTLAGSVVGLRLRYYCLRIPVGQANFIVNHPFMFAVVSHDDDILFMGRLITF